MRPAPQALLLCAALAALSAAHARPVPVAGHAGAGGGCVGCHAEAARYGHPAGFEPARALPAAYVLDAGGRFTCGTCHAPMAAGTAAAACADCHDADFFTGMADAGLSLFGRAHLPALRGAGVSAADGWSALCLDCHVEHGEHTGAGPRQVRTGGRPAPPRNHPVGTPYARYADYGGYVPAARMNAAVRLPDGRISCVSCHLAYGARHGAPVLPVARSELCFACHDL